MRQNVSLSFLLSAVGTMLYIGGPLCPALPAQEAVSLGSGGLGVRTSKRPSLTPTTGLAPRQIQRALTHVLRGSPASAVILRLSDGAILATQGDQQAALPGSAIKPLLLSWALQHGSVKQDFRVFCRRSLRVDDRALPCTHPPDQTTFTAQSALAESCNTYFAAVALRMRGRDLEAALRATGLPHKDATDDTPEERELTMLGLGHVTATPMQLARAYRALLIREDPGGPVLRGLSDSVQFGMADAARVEEQNVLGKTGTANDHTGGRSHGWFAGGLQGSMVAVLYLPRGNGADAATLAGALFREAIAETRR